MIANGFSEQLLTHLQKELGRPALSYAEPPTRITGGFDTTIYSLRLDGVAVPYDKPLVLRVFRSDSDPRRAEFEALVQNTIASQGYPAPRTLFWSTDTAALGGAFMLMERIPGVTMLDLFLRPSLALFRLPAALADAQAALHALDPQPLASAIAASGLSNFMSGLNTSLAAMRNLVERYSLEGLRSGIAWLEEQRPPPGSPTICHGDFHPLNLLMANGQVVGVLDWSNVTVSEEAFDVGATRALMSSGPVDAPLILRPLATFGRGLLVRQYYRTYRARRSLRPDRVRYYEALRLLGFLTEAAERRLADAGAIPPVSKPSAFAAPGVAERIAHRFRKLTGVSTSIEPLQPGVV